jgi:heterodisulfide reductase subunit B
MKPRRYLYFPGCKLDPFLPSYGLATRAVLAALDVELVDRELNCCGYPVRHQDQLAALLAAARNLALAARAGLALMTPCQCCFGQLKHADYWLRRRDDLRRHINALLADEGLHWEAGSGVFHLLQVLGTAIGMETIRARIRQPLKGLDIAAHYGCHALRPGHVTGFDNPLAPTLFEKLVEVTGATAVNWPLRLECCGFPQRGQNDRLADRLMTRKAADARQAGARLLTTACTYCQRQFGAAKDDAAMPAMLYPQVLGRAMGIGDRALGIVGGDPGANW